MLETIRNAVWGPVTIINLSLIGVVILIKTRFYTLFKLPRILRDTILEAKRNKRAFSLMCTSLGGTIGVGNAIGVAGAITEGGAGAVFWMAIAGILGMAIKYAEVYLSLIFGGPIGYIKHGIGSIIGTKVYAVLCIFVSFGMGNMAQVRSAIDSIGNSSSFTNTIIALSLTVLFLIIASGGIEKIRGYSEIVIPLISVAYIFLMLIIIFKERDNLQFVFKNIAKGTGILTGFKWALIKKGLTIGFSKAIFSSEAGLGCAGFAHKSSDKGPSEQAKWGAIEVLIDASICILTSIAILLYYANSVNLQETFITRGVFLASFGKLGEMFYGISMLIFAFSSLLCWYYNGSCAVEEISSKKGVKIAYRSAFATIIILSIFFDGITIITISDIANAMMMLVNISALWVLVFNNSLTF